MSGDGVAAIIRFPEATLIREGRVLRLQIVIPMRNEAARIVELLTTLQACRGLGALIVVVDGGSTDDSMARARPLVDVLLTAAPSRGNQLAVGIAAADRPYLWLLHADTVIEARHPQSVVATLAEGGQWGRFDVCIDGRSPVLRLVAALMNVRTRLTGIVTGDHAIFCRRDLLLAAGGMPVQPLMEDIELSRRLRRISWPVALGPAVVTAGRRWERLGVWRTILTMWRFRLRYFFGASADALAQEYYGR